MSTFVCDDLHNDELYLAGERVAPGLYREIETHREILFDEVDFLPATLDGRVAAYACVRSKWAHVPQAHEAPAFRSAGMSLTNHPPQVGGDARITILLMSNRSKWSTMVRNILKTTEFEIIVAHRLDDATSASASSADAEIILLDLDRIEEDGLVQLHAVKSAHPNASVVLLPAAMNECNAARAVHAGAAGCLHQGITEETLLYALRAITCGAKVIAHAWAGDSMTPIID